MTTDQKAVAFGAASGISAMILSLWLLYSVLPNPDIFGLADRLAYALKWNAVAVLPLVAMFVAIGNARALGEAIDPTLGKEDAGMLINGKVPPILWSNSYCSWSGRWRWRPWSRGRK